MQATTGTNLLPTVEEAAGNTAAETAAPLQAVSPVKSGGEHYAFLDGLRGIGAVYIVLGHAIMIHYKHLSVRDQHLLFPLQVLGELALTSFFVLSGWCLMIPISKSAGLELRGGFWKYMRRRAQRILPPYYGAIFLAWLFPCVFHRLVTGTWPSHPFNFSCDYLGKRDLLAHLTLVHNFWPQYSQNISPPLWSVATEWQIYFCFALALLPVLRRHGLFACLMAATILGFAPRYLLPGAHRALPWMLLPFATGMVGAVLTYSQDKRFHAQAARLAVPTALLGLVLLLPQGYLPANVDIRLRSLGDPLVGLVAVGLILAAARQPAGARHRSLRRVLEWPVAVWLGRFSYSI